MQDSDLVRSPPMEASVSRHSFDPDTIRVNRKLIQSLSKFAKEFIDFELEAEELIHRHFEELSEIHQQVGLNLDQCKNENSREKNLKLILEGVAHRLNKLFRDSKKLRATIEKEIEEASSMIYIEKFDFRFPRSILLGFRVNKEIVVEDDDDVYSLVSSIQRYRNTLQDLTHQVDDLSKAHRLITLSHRAEELSDDQEASAAFDEGVRLIKTYTI